MGVLRDRVTLVWLVLVAATLLSFGIGGEHLVGDASVASAIVLLVAFLKTYLVGAYFMDLRGAPIALRAVFGGWVVVACGGVLGLYLLAG